MSGFSNPDKLSSNPDLASLRGRHELDRILAAARAKLNWREGKK